MRRPIAILVLFLLLLCAFMFSQAHRMPVMRSATLPLKGLAAGHQPIRVALLSDTHLSGPDSSPERLRAIVAAINAEHPDLVLLAGDYLGDRKLIGHVYSREEAIAPFAKFEAPLGTIAVLGNHEHWDEPAKWTEALKKVGVTVLANQAIERGPLAIGGIDDAHTGHADPRETLAAVRRLSGAPLLFTHSPDVFPDLLPGAPTLLAGHTHCGQVVLPLYGAITVPSRYGSRYLCGRYEEYGKTMIVGGGVGTTSLPFRLLATPEWWLITFEPPKRKGEQS